MCTCRHFCFNIFNKIFASCNCWPFFHIWQRLYGDQIPPRLLFSQPDINAPSPIKMTPHFKTSWLISNFSSCYKSCCFLPFVFSPVSVSRLPHPVHPSARFDGRTDIPVIRSDLQLLNKVRHTKSTSSETQTESLTFKSSTGLDNSVDSVVM